MFTDMLQQWARQASAHRTSIGWLLRGYDRRRLRERLRCDESTVCGRQLYGLPAAADWERGVEALARDLGRDQALLAGLLREAEAAQRRQPAVAGAPPGLPATGEAQAHLGPAPVC